MIFTELKTGKSLNFVNSPAVFALGSFDGVHLGHRKVLLKAVEEAKRHNWVSVAWCLFLPSIAEKGELLCDKKEKAELLREVGCDYAVFENFDAVRTMSPSEFVTDYLIKNGCRASVCGFNFRFGKEAAGDSAYLSSLCKENGILSYSVSAEQFDGSVVSSTRIRNLLKEGNASEAAKLLSYSYSFTGEVMHGRHLGKGFGFPTVNLNVKSEKLIPLKGVYFTRTVIDGKSFPSLSNIGICPSVGGDSLRIETHILGIDFDLYEKELTVKLECFRRAEKKFADYGELVDAIKEDKKAAEKYFGI